MPLIKEKKKKNSGLGMTKRKHEVEEQSDSSAKKAFKIDWNSVLEDEDDSRGGGGKERQVPELLIVNTKPHPPSSSSSSSSLSGDQMDCHRNITDRALDEQLERNKSHLVKLGPHLPDNGEKIRLSIASLEAEKQRRVLQRSNMVRILITSCLIFLIMSCLFGSLSILQCWVVAKTLSFTRRVCMILTTRCCDDSFTFCRMRREVRSSCMRLPQVPCSILDNVKFG